MNCKIPGKYLEDLEKLLRGETIPGVKIFLVDHGTLKKIAGENAKEYNFGAIRKSNGVKEIYINKDMNLGSKYGVGAHEFAHPYLPYGDEIGTDELAMKALSNLSMDSTKPVDIRVKAEYALKSLCDINELSGN